MNIYIPNKLERILFERRSCHGICSMIKIFINENVNMGVKIKENNGEKMIIINKYYCVPIGINGISLRKSMCDC